MRAYDFKAAVDEIRKSGGSRQTLYIREAWRDRCMTIFGYVDGSAEVFEETHPYMAFNSVAEAVLALNKIQGEEQKGILRQAGGGESEILHNSRMVCHRPEGDILRRLTGKV